MLVVKEDNGFKKLVYKGISIKSGNVLYNLSGTIKSKPTRTSIQISPTQHIEDRYGQYINHHCFPNIKVIGKNLLLIKDLNDGDEITFDYNDSEYKMSNPFHCHCCGKLIKGYFDSEKT